MSFGPKELAMAKSMGLVATDSSGGISGPTFYIPTNFGRFEKALSTNGVVANGTTNDASAFQAAVLEFQATGLKDAWMPAGVSVNCGTGIVFDIDKIQLNLRRSALVGDAMTSAGSLVSFTNSLAFSSSMETPYMPIYNGTIKRNTGRDDSYNNSIVGVSLDSGSSNYPVANIILWNLYIQGFRDGANMGRNSYIVLWDGVKFVRNWTGAATRNVSAGNKTNQGERMAFKGCVFANNYEHTYIEGEDWWMDLVSMDYPSIPSTGIAIGNRKQRSLTIKNGAHVDIRRMNLEFRDNSPNSNDRSQIYLEDADSSFIWDGGRLECSDGNGDNSGVVGNGADGYQSYANLNSLVQLGGTGIGTLKIDNIRRGKSGIFASRKLVSLRDASSATPRVMRVRGLDDPKGSPFVLGKSIAPILGDASETGGSGFGLLRRPTFDALPTEDFWCIYGTGGGTLTGQTSRFASTSFNVTQTSNQLVVTKASNGSTAGRLMLLVPVELGATIGWKFTASSSVAANVSAFADFVNITPNSTSFLIVPQCNSIKSVARGTTLALTTSDQTFDTHSYLSNTINLWDTGDRLVPPGATHFRMIFQLDALDGSTTPFVMNLKNMTVGAV